MQRSLSRQEKDLSRKNSEWGTLNIIWLAFSSCTIASSWQKRCIPVRSVSSLQLGTFSRCRDWGPARLGQNGNLAAADIEKHAIIEHSPSRLHQKAAGGHHPAS